MADFDPVLGEINNIDGTALPDHASERPQEWVRRFNNVQHIAELEDHLLQYGKEAKAASRVRPPRPWGGGGHNGKNMLRKRPHEFRNFIAAVGHAPFGK
jgi:hypothetical protein